MRRHLAPIGEYVDRESERCVDPLPLGLGDQLLRASRNADQFAARAEVLDRAGATVAMLTRWMKVNSVYCADDPARADLSIVSIVETADDMGPRVYDAVAELAKLGHAPESRRVWWRRISADQHLALSVLMTLAVTITDRIPGVTLRALHTLEQRCAHLCQGDTSAASAAAQIVVGRVAERKPVYLRGMEAALTEGTSGDLARICLLHLAADTIDPAAPPAMVLDLGTSGDGVADLDQLDPRDVADPAIRAHVIAAQMAIALARDEDHRVLGDRLDDLDPEEWAHLLTFWAEMAADPIRPALSG